MAPPVTSRAFPAFASSGATLAYFEQVPGGWRLRVRDLITGVVAPVADSVPNAGQTAWGADGALVRLQQNRVVRAPIAGTISSSRPFRSSPA